MYVTMTEMYLLLDTVKGSLVLADGVDSPLFAYKREVRQQMYNTLVNRMYDIVLVVKEEEDAPEGLYAAGAGNSIPTE